MTTTEVSEFDRESEASTMGGRRTGSLHDLRRARKRYEQEKLLNVFLYLEDVGWGETDVDAILQYVLRHLVSKRQYKRRVRELESRISQSSCVEKRDFSNSFDDAERYRGDRVSNAFVKKLINQRKEIEEKWFAFEQQKWFDTQRNIQADQELEKMKREVEEMKRDLKKREIEEMKREVEELKKKKFEAMARMMTAQLQSPRPDFTLLWQLHNTSIDFM